MHCSILQHESFIKSGAELLVSLVGGSNLYGLNTPESDVDYRGIFVTKHPHYLAGFSTLENIVQSGETDATYYELQKFLGLMRKSNTQVLEILFAPNSAIVHSSPAFEEMVENRYKLINSDTFKSSIKGYVFSEIRLATGERVGQLGRKRKVSLEKYGYSPKNFCQILRLCKVGCRFFTDGDYVVNVRDMEPDYHKFLMEIKTQPQNFACEALEKIVWEEFAKLEKIIDNSKIKFEFDLDYAADLVLRYKYGKQGTYPRRNSSGI